MSSFLNRTLTTHFKFLGFLISVVYILIFTLVLFRFVEAVEHSWLGRSRGEEGYAPPTESLTPPTSRGVR